jgi:hypothetical protein
VVRVRHHVVNCVDVGGWVDTLAGSACHLREIGGVERRPIRAQCRVGETANSITAEGSAPPLPRAQRS